MAREITHHPLIQKCPVCAKRFLTMRRISLGDGVYKFAWETRRKYCSAACKAKAYRRRKQSRPAYPSQ